jgi:hypothetical protein
MILNEGRDLDFRPDDRMVRMMKVVSVLLAGTLAIATVAAQKPIPVILDTDIGDDIDDALALGLALQSPELNVLAVNTVSNSTGGLKFRLVWARSRRCWGSRARLWCGKPSCFRRTIICLPRNVTTVSSFW